MYCKFCGNEISDDAVFCEKCGNRVNADSTHLAQNQEVVKKGIAISIVAIVLGILSVIAWIIPLIGYPITIAGLVFGIIGYSKEKRGMAVAGIVLSAVFLVLTIVNSALGALQGYSIAKFLQQDNEVYEESENGEHILEFVVNYGEENEEVILTGDNVLSATPETDSESYVVNITLDEEGTQIFADATMEYVGEQIYILYDEKVISSPTVQTAILDGKVVISGLETYEEAEEISDYLNE